MNGNSSRKAAYLALDELTANPKLAQLLPPDLAHRFHALPVAEDEGRITVVMADPDDPVAREAVVTVLGPASCVVQGDPAAIDTALEELWPYEGSPGLTLLVCDFPDPVSDLVWSYAEALGQLLGAQVKRRKEARELAAPAREGEAAQHHLLVFENPEHPLVRYLLSPQADRAARDRQCSRPAAILTARQPRWPLTRILLVMCGEDIDRAAVAWVVCLARRSGSAVTVLAVVPPAPAMYGQRPGMDQGLSALLSTDTPLGRKMRWAARQLVDWEIAGSLRLRQGPPDWQVDREIVEGDYDLIVVAARGCPSWLRWLGGDPIGHILRRADRPVLLACQTTV